MHPVSRVRPATGCSQHTLRLTSPTRPEPTLRNRTTSHAHSLSGARAHPRSEARPTGRDEMRGLTSHPYATKTIKRVTRQNAQWEGSAQRPDRSSSHPNPLPSNCTNLAATAKQDRTRQTQSRSRAQTHMNMAGSAREASLGRAKYAWALHGACLPLAPVQVPHFLVLVLVLVLPPAHLPAP